MLRTNLPKRILESWIVPEQLKSFNIIYSLLLPGSLRILKGLSFEKVIKSRKLLLTSRRKIIVLPRRFSNDLLISAPAKKTRKKFVYVVDEMKKAA
jgi:hypothetical protein